MRQLPLAGLAFLAALCLLTPPHPARAADKDTPQPAGPVITGDLSCGVVVPCPDAKSVLTFDRKNLHLIDAATGKSRLEPLPAPGIPPGWFSQDGTQTSLSIDQVLDLKKWEVVENKVPDEVRRLHREGGARWGPGGVVTLHDRRRGRVLAWDVFAQEPLGKPIPFRCRGPFLGWAVSPDRTAIVLHDTGRGLLWNLANDKPIGRPLTPPRGARFETTTGSTPAGFAFSPDGKALLAVSSPIPRGPTVVKTLPQARKAGPPGSTFLVLYEAATGKRLWGPLRCGSGGIRHFLFSPDGKLLATAFDPKTHAITFWDTASGKPTRQITVPEFEGALSHCALAFSPDGRTLALTYLPRQDRRGQPGTPGAIRTPGGTPATKERAFHVQLFDVATGKPVGEAAPVTKPSRFFPQRVKQILFAEDGKTFLTVTGGPQQNTKAEARLWKVPESRWPKSDSPGEKSTEGGTPGPSGSGKRPEQDRQDR